MTTDRKESIINVGDMIEYLLQFDRNKPLVGQYIQTIGNQIVDVKERPLLKKSFIKDIGDAYVIELLYY